jgi:hypothetical protein
MECKIGPLHKIRDVWKVNCRNQITLKMQVRPRPLPRIWRKNGSSLARKADTYCETVVGASFLLWEQMGPDTAGFARAQACQAAGENTSRTRGRFGRRFLRYDGSNYGAGVPPASFGVVGGANKLNLPQKWAPFYIACQQPPASFAERLLQAGNVWVGVFPEGCGNSGASGATAGRITASLYLTRAGARRQRQCVG